MKKLFLSVLMVSLVATAMAQDYSKKEVRDAKQTERQQAMVQQLTNALKTHNFTFAASQATPEFMGPQQALNQWNNYVSVYPGYLEVNLPYTSVSQNVTMIPRRVAINTTQFNFWEDMNNGSQWTLVFQTDWSGVKYVFHLNYDIDNGMATLTLVPNQGNTVVYTGSIQAN
ncbi:MAG: DUF4251 domain-containing protein [Rikenella sp.]|nr:DUF4251 domain-containing protein [Rikenella sp.]